MFILLFFAFLSGLVTILAPCIWPLLPLVLSTSATGGHKKPLGITSGIVVSFFLFTLTISYLVSLFHFDPNILRLLAVFVIGFLGITMIIPLLSVKLKVLLSRVSGSLTGTFTTQKSGFTGELVTGFSLGIVWSPCAGPILATIATLGATQAVTIRIVLISVSYAIGVFIPLFLFSSAGSWVFKKSKVFSPYAGRIQQLFGVVMIVTAALIYTNYDKILQAQLLDAFPSYSRFLTQFESSESVTQQLNALKNKKTEMFKDMPSSDLSDYGKAPEFVGITKWLNTPHSLTMKELKGKVVLVDFWTYTCINCIRTLPYVTSWYDKYKDKGFVVVGVHTPEFEFEKKTENVLQVIKQYNIHYPVAQDNEYATWNAFGNQYWPAEYLIDSNGVIRREHFGEGGYDETEMAIKKLLQEKGASIDISLVPLIDQTPKSGLTPETYLGSSRMQYLYPDGQGDNGTRLFTLSSSIPLHAFDFGGEWTIENEHAIAGKNAVLEEHFFASKVFFVVSPSKNQSSIKVFLDGKIIDETRQGVDVKNGMVEIDKERLYNLVDLQGKTEEHILRLKFSDGISAFAFTFG